MRLAGSCPATVTHQECKAFGLEKGSTDADGIAVAMVRAAMRGKLEVAREIREATAGRAPQRAEMFSPRQKVTLRVVNEAQLAYQRHEAEKRAAATTTTGLSSNLARLHSVADAPGEAAPLAESRAAQVCDSRTI